MENKSESLKVYEIIKLEKKISKNNVMNVVTTSFYTLVSGIAIGTTIETATQNKISASIFSGIVSLLALGATLYNCKSRINDNDKIKDEILTLKK